MSDDQQDLGNRPLLEFDLKDDGTASLRITPADKLDPERRAELAKSLDPANWPERRRKSWEAMQRVNSRGEPTYAIADHFIEENVLAVVVRDPGTVPDVESSTSHGADTVRMVIVPADATDDTSVCFGKATLRQDEMSLFEAPVRRVLTLFADRRVRLETTGDMGETCVKWRQSSVTVYNVRDNTMRRIRRLTRAVETVETKEIAGVGTIRIVPSRGSTAWSEWERWIDGFNKVVGSASADLLESDPSLIERGRQGIHRLKDIMPTLMPEEIRAWERILSDESGDAALVRVLSILRDSSPEAALLRRASPFQGIVSEERRAAILRECDNL